jgi:hypothetical protein
MKKILSHAVIGFAALGAVALAAVPARISCMWC